MLVKRVDAARSVAGAIRGARQRSRKDDMAAGGGRCSWQGGWRRRNEVVRLGQEEWKDGLREDRTTSPAFLSFGEWRASTYPVVWPSALATQHAPPRATRT
jgi:hypothetical protein